MIFWGGFGTEEALNKFLDKYLDKNGEYYHQRWFLKKFFEMSIREQLATHDERFDHVMDEYRSVPQPEFDDDDIFPIITPLDGADRDTPFEWRSKGLDVS